MFRNILCGVSCAAGILTSFAVYVIGRVVEAGDNALADVGNPPPKRPAASEPPVDRLTAHYRSAKRRAGTLPAPIYPVVHWDDHDDGNPPPKTPAVDPVTTAGYELAKRLPLPNPALHWEDDVVDAVFKALAARES